MLEYLISFSFIQFKWRLLVPWIVVELLAAVIYVSLAIACFVCASRWAYELLNFGAPLGDAVYMYPAAWNQGTIQEKESSFTKKCAYKYSET